MAEEQQGKPDKAPPANQDGDKAQLEKVQKEAAEERKNEGGYQ